MQMPQRNPLATRTPHEHAEPLSDQGQSGGTIDVLNAFVELLRVVQELELVDVDAHLWPRKPDEWMITLEVPPGPDEPVLVTLRETGERLGLHARPGPNWIVFTAHEQ
jgi:hypothetical protein